MEQSIIVGLITFLLGLLLGHRLTLWRDRRKEFNNLTNEFYFKLKEIIECGAISNVSIHADRVERFIPFYKRHRFRKCVKRYEQSQDDVSKYDPAKGSVVVDEAKKLYMFKCAKEVLHYLRPR